jgi:ABC-type branched-subunit amino acid transport system permease subunit
VGRVVLPVLVLASVLHWTLVDFASRENGWTLAALCLLAAAALALALRRRAALLREVAWGAAMAFLLASTARGVTPFGHGTWDGLLLVLLGAAAALGITLGLRRAPRPVREGVLLAFVLLLTYWTLARFFGEDASPGRYLVNLTVIIAVYALLSLGLSVEMGHAGLFNFGHVAFAMLGAYTAVVFSQRAGPGLGPMLEGAGPGAVLFTALVALLGGLLVYLPLLLGARRLPLSPRAGILAAALPAALAALVLAWAILPLDARAAQNAVAVLGILLGVAAAAVGGLLLGLASLRLREDYLAIVTLGTSQILLLVALNEEWLTNGSQGILSFQIPVADWARGTGWWRDLARSQDLLPIPLAYAAVGVLAVLLAYLLLETLARSPWGRVMKAIREDEDVASALGKNVLWYKLQALMIGSGLAALAGVLFVWSLTSVLPTHFLAVVTFTVFAMLVLGGIGNHRGAILGAILIWGIFELGGSLNSVPFLAERGIQWAGPLQNIFVGLVLVLVVMFRPQGAVGSKEELSLGK